MKFVLGYEHFTWNQLKACIATMETYVIFSPSNENNKDRSPPTMVYPALERFGSLQAWRSQQKLPPLLDILQIYRQSTASDPRDKVYAALNVTTSSSAQGIEVNYGKSARDVYVDVCASQLARPDLGLDFLGFVLQTMSSEWQEYIEAGGGSKSGSVYTNRS